MSARERKKLVLVQPGGEVRAVFPDLTPGEQVEVSVRTDAELPQRVDHSAFGFATGRITIADDFDEPLAEFAEYI